MDLCRTDEKSKHACLGQRQLLQYLGIANLYQSLGNYDHPMIVGYCQPKLNIGYILVGYFHQPALHAPTNIKYTLGEIITI